MLCALYTPTNKDSTYGHLKKPHVSEDGAHCPFFLFTPVFRGFLSITAPEVNENHFRCCLLYQGIIRRKNNNEKVYLFDMGCPHLAFHFV